jgi:hypothetical protein
MARRFAIAGALAVAVGLALGAIGCGGDDDEEAEAKKVTVTTEDARPCCAPPGQEYGWDVSPTPTAETKVGDLAEREQGGARADLREAR